ncbi:MAG: DUF4167 domain-containing protein [Sphingomonas sp.]
MINNRQQSGRRRGRGGQNGQRPQNGRPELGNRIDNRARGNAPQLLEKYKTLARDAQQAGDRVLAEYYFQFADHYFRVLAESRARFEEANPNRPRQDYAEQEEQFDEDGNEIEREFDPRPPQQNRQEQAPRQDRYQREDRPREDRPREDRPQRSDQNRSDQNRNEQNRDDRPARQDRDARPERAAEDRPVRQDRYQRDDRPREDRPREDRPREERPRLDRARAAMPRARAPELAQDDDGDHSDSLPFDALPPAINVAAMEPVVGVEGEPVAVPKKRGRPKKVVAEAVTEE